MPPQKAVAMGSIRGKKDGIIRCATTKAFMCWHAVSNARGEEEFSQFVHHGAIRAIRVMSHPTTYVLLSNSICNI